MVVRSGCGQQMQPLSCEGCVAVLVAGVKETPPVDTKRCSIPGSGLMVIREGRGGKDAHGGFILL